MRPSGLRFDRPVARDGYVWWYVDALSDDGAHGLTVIAFVGSVFSPYYAWARRRGPAEPLNHCAFNVALYESRGGRWSMTERGAAQVQRESTQLSIGPSSMRWTGESLEISIDELCAPVPRRLRGTIRLIPLALNQQSYVLDDDGAHVWTPYAPCARIEAHFTEPNLNWTGAAYLDSNEGRSPLEHAFESWTWSRASVSDGSIVLYDTKTRSGADRSLALRFAANGSTELIEAPPPAPLPFTGWRVARATRADSPQSVRVIKTFEDAPFYSRSLLETKILGLPARAIHESLSLDRFSAPWVQCLLPFRMPRIAGGPSK